MFENQKFIYNAIPSQKLLYANQLTVFAWNDIINVLRTQSNETTTYIETLHKWLFGESYSVEKYDTGFVRTCMSLIEQLRVDVDTVSNDFNDHIKEFNKHINNFTTHINEYNSLKQAFDTHTVAFTKHITSYEQHLTQYSTHIKDFAGFVDSVYRIYEEDIYPTKNLAESNLARIESLEERAMVLNASSVAYVYDTYDQFINSVCISSSETQTIIEGLYTRYNEYIPKENLKIGNSIYIKDKGVPDYWLSDLFIDTVDAEPIQFFSELESLGGGGGAGTSSITLTPESPVNATISLSGSYSIVYSFKHSRGEQCTAMYYINGVQKGSARIDKGSHSFDLTGKLRVDDNVIEIVVRDDEGNSSTITFFVTAIELRLVSNFNDSIIYNGDVAFRYTPYGAIDKTIVFKINNENEITRAITSTGESLTETFEGFEHGVYSLEVYMYAIVENSIEPIKSNVLHYNIIHTLEGHKDVLISSNFNTTTATQGDLLSIDYIIYDPSKEYTDAQLQINGTTVQNIVVGRSRQIWNIFDYPAGDVLFTIYTATKSKSFTVKVTESSIDPEIQPVETNLDLYLHAKNRSNNESDDTRSIWSYDDISATMSGFNWASNGWMHDSAGYPILRLNGSAKVVIPFKIFSTNFLVEGKTIEFDFSTRNIYDINKTLIESLSNDKGFLITSNECSLASSESYTSTKFKEDSRIRISFVIESKDAHRLIKTYINGIQSGLVQYPSSDNFMQLTPVDITINPNQGDVDIYSIRIYSQALSDRQILNNYMYDLPSGEKEYKYVKNNLFTKSGIVDYVSVSKLIPVLTITGDLPAWKGDKKTVSVYFSDPFTKNTFTYDNVTIDVQGTSSQYYPRKNYKLTFNTSFSFYEGAIPESVYTMKADFMESSHSHNTGNGILLNTLSPKTYAQNSNPNLRNSIYGFPIAIFAQQSSTSELVYYGIFNFNNDKGNSDTLGLVDRAESWEFKNNTSARCLFRSNDFINNVSDDFEARYPDKYTDYTNLSAVISWVYSTENDIDKFKTEFNNYFNFEFCLFYYIMMEVILAADSRAKNMFLDYLPINETEYRWHPRWYDIDTCYGLNNEGVNTFGYGLEQHDAHGTGNVYNGENSLFWNNFELAFASEIKSKYNDMRSNGNLNYETIIDILKGRQIDKISEAMYNTDGEFKYIQPLTNSPEIGEDGTPIPNATYLYVSQGNRLNHLEWWLSNRFKYLDSKYDYADYMKNYITMRVYTPDNATITPTRYFDITPYIDMYLHVKFGSVDVGGNIIEDTSQELRIRAKSGVSKRVTAPSGLEFNDTETIIYGASEILDIGDLSAKYAGTMDFSKAVRLKALNIGNTNSSYTNANLTSLTIGNLTMLETLNIQGCTSLDQTLDLSGCDNIRIIDARRTKIKGVTLKRGGNLRYFYHPDTIVNLSIVNQPFFVGPILSNYPNLKTLWMTRNSVLRKGTEFSILKVAPNIETVRLTDIDWTVAETDRNILSKLYICFGLDEEGNLIEHSVLTGKIHIVGSIDKLLIDSYRELWGDSLIITADKELDRYECVFKNIDGTVLYTTTVVEGEYVTYVGDEPAYPYEDPYGMYNFAGWDPRLPDTPIIQNTDFIADYPGPSTFVINIPEFNLAPSVDFSNPLLNDIIIDWGDGNIESYTTESSSHTCTKSTPYTTPGEYTVRIPYRQARFYSSNSSKYLFYISGSNSTLVTIKSAIISQHGFSGNYHFYNSYRTLSTIIFKYVATIPDFSYVRSLYNVTKLYMDDNTTSLTRYGFMSMGALSDLRVSKNITSIPEYTFYGCASLTSFTIPDKVSYIDYGAFDGCDKLTYLYIPKNVTNIDSGLGISDFHKAGSGLSTIEVDSANTNYMSMDGVLYDIKSIPTLNTYPCNKPDVSYTIPDFVLRVEINALAMSKHLEILNVSPSVTDLFYMPQYTYLKFCSHCPKLREINVVEDNTVYASNDSVLYNKNYTILYRCPPAYMNTTLTVLDSVTSFDSSSMYGCTTLTSIKLLGVVPPTISSSLFSNCSNLQSIIVPKGYLETYQTATNWSSYASIMVEDEE